MKKKRLLGIAILLGMAVFCVGCGNDEDVELSGQEVESTLEGLNDLNQNTAGQEKGSQEASTTQE